MSAEERQTANIPQRMRPRQAFLDVERLKVSMKRMSTIATAAATATTAHNAE